jgi:uncharacterized repeat protein (TIGR02543 family)
LNLASILFTSDASGAGGKAAATAGGNLVAATAPSGVVKFTVQDDSQTLTVIATTAESTQSGSTLTFSYSNATTGTNQYVSCVLEQAGAVKYYGKLIDSSAAESGTLSIPLAGVDDGTYTLKIFSEEINGDNYTDFCSEPIYATLEVDGGTGTITNPGTLRVLSNDAELISVAGETITATGTGTSVSPKTASVTVANGVTSVALANITASTGATAHIYSDSGFSADEDTDISLSVGANHVYVKVISEDSSVTIYYDVTVNRQAPPDTTAPVLTAGAVSRTSDTAATAKFTSDEAGDYYYAVVADGTSQPTINTTGAGTACDTTEQTVGLTLTAGAKDLYIVVKDAAGNVSAAAFKIDIPAYVAPPVPVAPTITTSSLPGGTVGTAYSQTLSATGDTPITWSVGSGLPNGLSLSAAGVISGTPTASGTFTFTVKAANGVNPDDTKQFSITVTEGDSGEPTDPTTYNFTGTAGAGGTVSGTASGSYTEGTAISVTATANSGYRFTGWTISGAAITDGNTANPAAFSMPANSVTLTANFEADGAKPNPPTPSTPATGDGGNPFLYVLLGLAGLCGLGLLAVYWRKRGCA